ncbi:hypothetical protein D8674_042394 [Pyrus ussuriensis x Pyrus communis]|uniref:No apical meristem-associated C-terminal domain-containing protein n=1 Tax=Pyrus ussuriensis x Pyrus communis TaxID=2448454 RepID=A0A5N5HCB7_9ROSA|nr:hypothetical protein D8674_042394 [Pyrus ussuriensis x Pyrus communis]
MKCWEILRPSPKWNETLFINELSPIANSFSVNNEDLMELVPKTQNSAQTSTQHQRPIGNKKAKAQKENGIAHDIGEEAKLLASSFMACKERFDNKQELKLMMTETSKIETPARSG